MQYKVYLFVSRGALFTYGYKVGWLVVVGIIRRSGDDVMFDSFRYAILDVIPVQSTVIFIV